MTPNLATARAAANGARGLRLLAAPSFAVMALLSAYAPAGAADFLCVTTGHGSPLTGMTAMYALMTVFHLPAWLALPSRRHGAAAISTAPAALLCEKRNR